MQLRDAVVRWLIERLTGFVDVVGFCLAVLLILWLAVRVLG